MVINYKFTALVLYINRLHIGDLPPRLEELKETS